MKISALADAADVPVATIKYYLREGLLPPGHPTSRTTAEYDTEHVDRLRLVRALLDVGGLRIAQVRQIVAVIEGPDPARGQVLAAAHGALVGDPCPPQPEDVADPAAARDEAAHRDAARSGRIQEWMRRRGWPTHPADPLLHQLDRAWNACEQADVPLDPAMLDRYADAVETLADVDLDSVPASTDGAVRRVVVGTVMTEPVLAVLRMMAQRHLAVQRYGEGERPPGASLPEQT